MLFCLLNDFHKNETKMKIAPDVPRFESGLIQMIRMGKSICHKWVKGFMTSGNSLTSACTESRVDANDLVLCHDVLVTWN